MNGSVEVNMSAFEMVPRIPKRTSVICCLIMSILYVSSLYVWKDKQNRDHPATVKRRFLSVTVIMMLTPIFVYKFSSKELLDEVTFYNLLGFRFNGLVMAIVIPVLLTILLFLGPLCVELSNSKLKVLIETDTFCSSLTDILWIRNHIIAPLSEEFVFRACMMPLILQSFSALSSVFITPLFFGIAHMHHISERLSTGMDFKTAAIVSLSQLTYTTLFGFYSAYLFVRTGHFVAPFLVHSVCNHVGLPDVREVWQERLWKRCLFISFYIIGFLGWIYLLPLTTQPHIYLNDIFWPKD